jgi:pyruvate/2-oxoglutarate dehydrogenase complex dihydrolipoamide dehydrogenase (E3) component
MSSSAAELIMGSARFVAPKTLEVRLNDGGMRVLAGDQVFLNLGTHALIPAVPGLEAARPLTHIEGSNSTMHPRIWWCSAAAMSASNWRRLIAASAAA